jgi:hypothetical protein
VLACDLPCLPVRPPPGGGRTRGARPLARCSAAAGWPCGWTTPAAPGPPRPATRACASWWWQPAAARPATRRCASRSWRRPAAHAQPHTPSRTHPASQRICRPRACLAASALDAPWTRCLTPPRAPCLAVAAPRRHRPGLPPRLRGLGHARHQAAAHRAALPPLWRAVPAVSCRLHCLARAEDAGPGPRAHHDCALLVRRVLLPGARLHLRHGPLAHDRAPAQVRAGLRRGLPAALRARSKRCKAEAQGVRTSVRMAWRRPTPPTGSPAACLPACLPARRVLSKMMHESQFPMVDVLVVCYNEPIEVGGRLGRWRAGHSGHWCLQAWQATTQRRPLGMLEPGLAPATVTEPARPPARARRSSSPP